MNDVVAIISNVGFPIAMCVFLMFYVRTLTEKHEQEINALKDTLNENTKILTELTTLIRHLANGKE